ncbi:type VII secretion-associated serine protease mycosin [Mycobacterium sp. pUA109]|uniref:type VII secretion-associated serine protease mycosin n=1 Tax=Mycobacterium sp. pUA109 TaxID=3238982 RepID=UPI00351BB661
MKRAVLAWLAVGVTALLASAPALAISPPQVDQAVPPPDGAPGPVAPMDQRGDCVASAVLPGTQPGTATAAQQLMNLPAAFQFSRGEGQTVAILDTGVRPGPRLPAVDAGGDYLATTDGLTDCDGHGTLIAGIVAGQPGDDGFSGVAPAARLLSMRVTSATLSPKGGGGEDPALARAAVDLDALSRAIVHAADMGARVITIPTVTCLPTDRPVDQTALGAALRYAAVDKDAVIVAAAGDVGRAGAAGAGTACDSNPPADLSRPDDPHNWAGVTSVSVPSWWQPYVLSVASLGAAGHPSPFTMAGPWVGIAAPGENVVSVSNRDDGGLANALPGDKRKLVPLSGTGYATGYVAGVATLVRSKYPGLSATQVVDRLTRTAHNAAHRPSTLVGAGTVDPVAALTWELPAATHDTAPARQLDPPPPPPVQDPTPRIVAYAGTAALALAVGAAAVIAARRRKEPTS